MRQWWKNICKKRNQWGNGGKMKKNTGGKKATEYRVDAALVVQGNMNLKYKSFSIKAN